MHTMQGEGSGAGAPGEVTYAQLALDFELTVQRAPPARPEHAPRMAVLPLQERATVLRQAIRALQPHRLVGQILRADESMQVHCSSRAHDRTQ